MPYTPPRETLATGACQPNSEALATHVVLAHPCTTFHSCTCGLCGGTATIAAMLIGYDDRGGCSWETREPKAIVIDYFLYTDARLRSIAALTLLPLLSTSSGNDNL
jgi:hypothetical protein